VASPSPSLTPALSSILKTPSLTLDSSYDYQPVKDKLAFSLRLSFDGDPSPFEDIREGAEPSRSLEGEEVEGATDSYRSLEGEPERHRFVSLGRMGSRRSHRFVFVRRIPTIERCPTSLTG
jgi:hypothetical protein